MNLKTYLAERKGWVEAELKRSIDDPSIPQQLAKAMRYSLEAGGKRLRPVLAFAAAEAVGSDARRAMPAAVALEMIHTFSLIHDDLPAMDDDSLRRGKPTNHKVFGEATAILAGDALLAEAFSALAHAAVDVSPVQLIEVIADIADATGCRGMTGGQQIDIDATGETISLEALEGLHRYKTGALIRVALTSGAKLAGADAEQVERLAHFGEAIGLAFQIADDVLDIEGDQSLMGKDIGSDEGQDKSTYPSIIGLDASKRRAAALIDEAVETIAPFGEKGEPLGQIARYIIERTS